MTPHRPSASRHARPRLKNKVTVRNVFSLFRRLAILAVAIMYIRASIQSSYYSLRVLRGTKNAPMKFEAYETTNLIKYMGKGLVTESPLVLDLLKNDTTPRAYSMFIEADSVSTTGCSTPLFNKALYSNTFLRLCVASLTRDTYFNLTELVQYQIVVPIVDCSFTPIQAGVSTNMRMFYLMKHKLKPGVLALAAVRFNMQNFRIPTQKESGPIGFASYTFIYDMQSQKQTYKFAGAIGYPFVVPSFSVYLNHGLDDEGWWNVTSISPNVNTTPPFQMTTASRIGFFVKSDSEQCNIKNLHWGFDDDPVSAITKWNWKGEPVLRDSWAWVHFLHVYFALDGVFNLLVLFLIIFRNLQKGKIWIGDAFVSISSSLLPRGFAILISWVINGYWSLKEMSLHDAHHLAKTQDIYFHPEIIRADLLTIHLAISTVLGYIFRERIDPIIAVVAFELGFSSRLSLATKWAPSILEYVKAYARMDHERAVVSVSDTVSAYAPLRLSTTHPLPGNNKRLFASCLFPVFSTAILILAYVVLRKIYHKLRPSKMRVIKDSNITGQSEDDHSLLQHKRNLTIVELSTGAELQARFGVISDFENYLIIKGMKYASADGIYSNGFVIINDKVLVATADLPSVLFMKLLHMRIRNVYIHEIDGSTVQRTAKLLYPHALTWRDLTHMNINVLS